ncbi:hypothetical protein ACNAN0_04480 [Agrilactobacillus fermenti]|uniref:hypothetical protein n=1 Tax=Agrilactobacillus fermenti TaxID=2586909 RepID=UPI001E4060FE|nr:hypothetical protein [Agrilactobacillus fermenti]MCD2256745.1 hypothetical protein [Agrilactobacillus fermenti]
MVQIYNSESDHDFTPKVFNIYEQTYFESWRPLLRKALEIEIQQNNMVLHLFFFPKEDADLVQNVSLLEHKLQKVTEMLAEQGFYYANQKPLLNGLRSQYQQLAKIIGQYHIDPDQALMKALLSNGQPADLEREFLQALQSADLSLADLPEKQSIGPDYEPEIEPEIQPNSFYDQLFQILLHPYLRDPALHWSAAANLTSEGQQVLTRLNRYATRDWDQYYAHYYDEQELVKQLRGLTDQDYYDQMEHVELKYVDQAYADVLQDLYQATLSKLQQVSIEPLNTPLPTHFFEADAHLMAQIHQAFKLDTVGKEHVLSAPILEIKRKYDFYRQNF